MMDDAWLTRLRAGLLIWAGLIGVFGAWITATELLRSRLDYFPANRQQAEQLSVAHRLASLAATVGIIRGGLWTAAAMTEATPLLFNSPGQRLVATSRVDLATAQRTTELAARLAPHDSRNWLMLAGLESRRGNQGRTAREALKLSYYTGANDFALIPLRLLVAASIPWDQDLQAFVQLEIDRILLERPDLKPAIAAAYKAADPQMQQSFETILRNSDPDFLATLMGGAQH